MLRSWPTPTILGLILAWTRVGMAEPSAAERARRLGASPNRPSFGLEYRGAWRAALGAELPLGGRRSRDQWAVGLLPLVELHNEPHPDSFVPNEYWRARIGAEGWWSPRRGRSLSLELGLALEHESDHSTARYDSTWGFTTLNDLGLKELVVIDLGPLALGLGLELDLYAWSCTRRPQHCTSYEGTTTAGGAANLVADLGRSWSVASWQPFVAIDASGILGRGEMLPEERVVLHAGAWHSSQSSGLFQVYLLGFFGHEVGVHRNRSVRELGAGFGWSPP
jgi:hypothetical protein